MGKSKTQDVIGVSLRITRTESQRLKKKVAKDAEERYDYMNKVRTMGTGPRRIGNPIPLTEDIYSMFFVTCLKTEFLYFHQKTHGKEGNDLKEEIDEMDKEENKHL